MINIACWNIHGFNNDKLDDDSFISSMCKYDIVGLVETMITDSTRNLPGFAPPFVVKGNRRKRRGRPSGGILVFCKPGTRSKIIKVKQSDFSIWFKLDKAKFGLKKSTFLCYCYIKPYQNKDTSELNFSKLESEISNFASKGEILICGDLNARIGGLKDYIEQDSVNQTFSDCPVPPNYSPDVPIQRNHLDKISNLQGGLLSNICRNNHLRILNGRFLGDSLGYFTFYNCNGQSTVDYMLASPNIFYEIKLFQVHPPSEHSDHCMISVMIRASAQSTVLPTESETFSIPGSFVWTEEKTDLFKDTLLQDDSIEDILSLNNNLDDPNCVDINSLVLKTNEIYLKAANKSLHFRRKKCSTRKYNKIRPKKIWMSNNCLLLRREVRSLGKRLALQPNNNALRLSFCNCKRAYNKLRKRLKKDFFSSLIQTINTTNPNNTKQFWNSLNKVKKVEDEGACPISDDDWQDHYKKLFISDNENSNFNTENSL